MMMKRLAADYLAAVLGATLKRVWMFSQEMSEQQSVLQFFPLGLATSRKGVYITQVMEKPWISPKKNK